MKLRVAKKIFSRAFFWDDDLYGWNYRHWMGWKTSTYKRVLARLHKKGML